MHGWKIVGGALVFCELGAPSLEGVIARQEPPGTEAPLGHVDPEYPVIGRNDATTVVTQMSSPGSAFDFGEQRLMQLSDGLYWVTIVNGNIVALRRAH